MIRPLAVVLIAAVSLSCGGSKGPTSPQAAALRIAAEGVLTIEAGQQTSLQIEDGGKPQDPSQYQWSSSDTSVATVSSTGIVRAAGGYGAVTVTAQASTGATAAVAIWVQHPESRPSTFRVTFVFQPAVNQQWRDAYAWAGERWSRVIRTELPTYDLTGHGPCRFPADVPAIAGPETGTRIVVLRSPNSNTGGPCTRRAMPRATTVLGVIEASHASTIDFDSPFTNLRGTAMHEIAHVLGLVGIPVDGNSPTPWFDTSTSRYTGAMGLEGYRRLFGSRPSFLALNPGDWHWKSFTGEIMTTPPSGPITTVSVGALMDIGYPAAWYGADK